MTDKNIKLKITHLCKVYLPTKGGVQAVIERLCRGLKDESEFTVITTSIKKKSASLSYAKLVESKAYMEIFSMPISLGFIAETRKSLNNSDIVTVHYPFPLCDIAISIFGKRKSKLIVYWHSEIIGQRRTKFLVRLFTKRMLKKADAIVVSSPKLIKFSNLLNPFKDKCHVIPFGVVKKSKNLTSQITKPSDGSYYLCVARHVPYKGIDVLLKAYASSKKDYRLVIVGSGPLLTFHKQLAETLNITTYVDFKVGINDESLDQYMIKCRALILSSVLPSEAFALVQIEAMSCGKPIINTQLESGVPWVARNEIEALTVKPNNETELTYALNRFSEDNLVDKLGQASTKRYLKEFSYEKFCERSSVLYQNIASSK